MGSGSITTDQSNRLARILPLTEKTLSKVQTLDSQIHAQLQVDEIEAAITFCTDLNGHEFINTDTIKCFLQNSNQTAESTGVKLPLSRIRWTVVQTETTQDHQNWIVLLSVASTKIWRLLLTFSSAPLLHVQRWRIHKIAMFELTSHAAKFLTFFTVTDRKYETILDDFFQNVTTTHVRLLELLSKAFSICRKCETTKARTCWSQMKA